MGGHGEEERGPHGLQRRWHAPPPPPPLPPSACLLAQPSPQSPPPSHYTSLPFKDTSHWGSASMMNWGTAPPLPGVLAALPLPPPPPHRRLLLLPTNSSCHLLCACCCFGSGCRCVPQWGVYLIETRGSWSRRLQASWGEGGVWGAPLAPTAHARSAALPP